MIQRDEHGDQNADDEDGPERGILVHRRSSSRSLPRCAPNDARGGLLKLRRQRFRPDDRRCIKSRSPPQRARIRSRQASGSPCPRGMRPKVIYLETSAAIRVLAVAHDRRKPGYWRSRLGWLSISFFLVSISSAQRAASAGVRQFFGCMDDRRPHARRSTGCLDPATNGRPAHQRPFTIASAAVWCCAC